MRPDLLLYSSKSKAFLTFLVPQLLPQLRRCQISLRRYGTFRHVALAILLISISSALLMSLGSSHNHRYYHNQKTDGIHHANKMRSQYVQHSEPETLPTQHPVSTDQFQRRYGELTRNQEATKAHSAAGRRALKNVHIARYERQKQRIVGRRRRTSFGERMIQEKRISSKKLHINSENQIQHNQHRRSQKIMGVRWSGHLDVENGTLRSLPFTRWNFDKDTSKFTPPQPRMTDVRVISLKDACFCTKRNKFIVPKRTKNQTRFPGFFYRYGAAKAVLWDRPASLLAFKNQTVVKISGRTILWRGRSLSLYQQHLPGSLIAIRSLTDILKRKNAGAIQVAAESLIEQGKRDIRTTKLHDYYLGDISVKRRIQLKEHRPKMICFDQVFALGSEFENHAMSHKSYENVKQLVEMSEKGRLQHRLVKSCKEGDANKNTIWIMDKQQTHGHYGSIANVAEVKIAVDHEIIKAGLAKTVTAKVIQAPNIVCPKGSAREGCMDLNCAKGYSKEDCIRSKSIFRDVVGFNNMTFLISTSGPGNNGLVYMPRGSHIVEVAPYGVYDRVHERAAKDAGMKYRRIENHGDRKSEERLYEQFGDVARSPRTCWTDFECRSVRMSRATVVNVSHLRFILRKALSSWKRSCATHVF